MNKGTLWILEELELKVILNLRDHSHLRLYISLSGRKALNCKEELISSSTKTNKDLLFYTLYFLSCLLYLSCTCKSRPLFPSPPSLTFAGGCCDHTCIPWDKRST
jgi:hypothetical protein